MLAQTRKGKKNANEIDAEPLSVSKKSCSKLRNLYVILFLRDLKIKNLILIIKQKAKATTTTTIKKEGLTMFNLNGFSGH